MTADEAIEIVAESRRRGVVPDLRGADLCGADLHQWPPVSGEDGPDNTCSSCSLEGKTC